MMEISRIDPKAAEIGGDGLTNMQRSMLAQLVGQPERHADVLGRFLASNAPHPFLQRAGVSFDERMQGLPEAARERALTGVQAGRGDRYTGIIATSVSRTHHNFSSGGHFYTVYAAQWGDQLAQLGMVVNEHGSIESPRGFAGMTTGRWVRVKPNSVYGGDWAFVWVDATLTRVPG